MHYSLNGENEIALYRLFICYIKVLFEASLTVFVEQIGIIIHDKWKYKEQEYSHLFVLTWLIFLLSQYNDYLESHCI